MLSTNMLPTNTPRHVGLVDQVAPRRMCFSKRPWWPRVAALRYVDLNPVRARLVVEAVSYEWSSAAAHVSGKDPTGLLDQEAWRELCPLNDWGEVLAAASPDEHTPSDCDS